MRFRSALLQLLVICAAGSSHAADLNQQALAPWEDYLGAVKEEMQERVTGKSPFL